MNKLNDEQRFIVNDVIYIYIYKHKFSSKPLHIFLKGGVRIG
jgi:hypothetical protein